MAYYPSLPSWRRGFDSLHPLLKLAVMQVFFLPNSPLPVRLFFALSVKSVAECYTATKILQECHKSRGGTVQEKIVEARRSCSSMNYIWFLRRDSPIATLSSVFACTGNPVDLWSFDETLKLVQGDLKQHFLRT